jgi:TIR domain
VKVFLSYRRDDTAGRAGRLADVFATRYGARNVFQDVAAAAPGLDFGERVDAAIANSDVMLVVIGPGWLASPDRDGGRRVDRPDDFVRREVGAALEADVRVVPVLVDGAELPPIEELPPELVGLLRRQAVSVRDISWHQDVDDLIRRLEDEEREPLRPARPRWLLPVGALVVIAAGIAIYVLVARDDSTGDSGDDASEGEPPACPVVDDTWTTLNFVDVDPVEAIEKDSVTASVQIVGAVSRFDGGAGQVLVDMDVENITEPVDGMSDEMYVGLGLVDGLLVDGLRLPSIDCYGVDGDPQIEPGERAIATIGFDTDIDPSTATLTLEVFDDLDLAVTDVG